MNVRKFINKLKFIARNNPQENQDMYCVNESDVIKAIQMAKKEVIDDIEKLIYFDGSVSTLNETDFHKLKERHLSTFAKEKRHNSSSKKDCLICFAYVVESKKCLFDNPNFRKSGCEKFSSPS